MAGSKLTTEVSVGLLANFLLAADVGSDAGQSLDGIDVDGLQSGATCYVRANDFEYRYLDSSVTPAAPPAVVAPLSGSGRWKLISGSSTAPITAFANLAALAAFNATGFTEATDVSVGVVNDNYRLILAPTAALLAAVDGVNVVTATGPAGAVWVRMYVRNLPAQYETTWFVDIATGSDANSGTVIGSPLKNIKELATRLRGATISANATWTIAAGDYSADPFSFDLTVADGVSILVLGNVSSTADTIFAILPTVPGAAATNAGAQRGTLTGTTFDFQTANDRQRLRITNGTALDAMAFITRIATAAALPGTKGVVNVSRWGKLGSGASSAATPRTSTIVTDFTVPNGSTYAVDTLNSRIGYLDLRIHGSGRLVIQDCLVRPAGTLTKTHRMICDSGNINGAMLYGCIFQSSASQLFQGGQFSLDVCSISADNGNIVYSGCDFAVHRKCVWTGTAVGAAQPGPLVSTSAFTLNVQNGTTLAVNNCGCLDGGGVTVQLGGILEHPGDNPGDMQFVDGTTGRAALVAQDGLWWSHTSSNLIWGLDNAYSTVAIQVDQGHWLYTVRPSVPGGSGNDFNVGGVLGAWATLPISVSTAAAGTAASAGAGALMAS